MKKKNKTGQTRLNFDCPSEIVTGLDGHIDGVKFRSRCHLMVAIFAEWLDSRKYLDQKKEDK